MHGRGLAWGNSSMDQASMEMVKAVGMVIFSVPAAPPVMYPPVILPKPRLGGPFSCNTTPTSASATFPVLPRLSLLCHRLEEELKGL